MIWVMLNETRGVNMQRWPALIWCPSSQTHGIRLSLEICCRSTPKAGWGLIPELGLTTIQPECQQYQHPFHLSVSNFYPICKGEIAYIYLSLEGLTRLSSLKLTEDLKIRSKCCTKITIRPYSVVMGLRWKEERAEDWKHLLNIRMCSGHLFRPLGKIKTPHQDSYDLWIRDVKTVSYIINFSPRGIQR